MKVHVHIVLTSYFNKYKLRKPVTILVDSIQSSIWQNITQHDILAFYRVRIVWMFVIQNVLNVHHYLVIFWIITILAILVLWYYPRGFLRKTLLLLPSSMSPTLNDEHCCSEMVLKCEPKSLLISRFLNASLTEYKAVCDNNFWVKKVVENIRELSWQVLVMV